MDTTALTVSSNGHDARTRSRRPAPSRSRPRPAPFDVPAYLQAHFVELFEQAERFAARLTKDERNQLRCVVFRLHRLLDPVLLARRAETGE